MPSRRRCRVRARQEGEHPSPVARPGSSRTAGVASPSPVGLPYWRLVVRQNITLVDYSSRLGPHLAADGCERSTGFILVDVVIVATPTRVSYDTSLRPVSTAGRQLARFHSVSGKTVGVIAVDTL